jgi:parallel beta helix pectate lyase-like protein
MFLVLATNTAWATAVVGTGTAASCTDAALNAALAGGGLVTFDCGGPATIDVSTGTGTKTITADTTIDGGGLITISGGSSVRVLSVNSGVNFTVENVTIADGWANEGGGIFNSGALIVTNSTFSDNRASLFNGGGAVSNIGGGPVTITGSTFRGNTSMGGVGGAISHRGGPLTVTNSTFTGNTSVGGGSGIVTSGTGPVTVTNSTFAGNSGSAGGRGGCCVLLLLGGGPTTVTNSTFSGNTGGAILNVGDQRALLRDTILDATGGLNDYNCSSAAPDIVDGGHNLDSGESCGFSAANGSLSNTDPQLDPAGLQDNGGPTQTVALCTAAGVPAECTAASPAIDAGDDSVCAAAPVSNFDQRGFGRPGAGHRHCSIGAYEADGTATVVCVGDCDGGGSVTVDELITLVNIALGNAQPSTCLHGVPGGATVDIALIIQAVDHALNSCNG